jgi:hypothetical protein
MGYSAVGLCCVASFSVNWRVCVSCSVVELSHRNRVVLCLCISAITHDLHFKRVANGLGYNLACYKLK